MARRISDCACEMAQARGLKILLRRIILITGHAGGETPGPISNPEVKPSREKFRSAIFRAAD